MSTYMDLHSLFNRAQRLVERGEYRHAAQAYETFLGSVQGSQSLLSPSEQQLVIRPAASNLAQALNRLGDYQKALKFVDLGLSHSPTNLGRAIALAARGEALCGIGRIPEGKAVFEEAAKAHPVVGRLNAADSMTRLKSMEFLQLSEAWVDLVVSSYSDMLDDDLWAEIGTIRGKIAAQRGYYDKARENFKAVLVKHPKYEDAKLQLRLLRKSAKSVEGNFLSRFFGRK